MHGLKLPRSVWLRQLSVWGLSISSMLQQAVLRQDSAHGPLPSEEPLERLKFRYGYVSKLGSASTSRSWQVGTLKRELLIQIKRQPPCSQITSTLQQQAKMCLSSFTPSASWLPYVFYVKPLHEPSNGPRKKVLTALPSSSGYCVAPRTD